MKSVLAEKYGIRLRSDVLGLCGSVNETQKLLTFIGAASTLTSRVTVA